ncbi:MAG: Signal recognition particle receptor protein FtsY (=alpha subunit) (TC 3.A.5.1.1) [uncultured Sulfurovum sp.]|uniref:Signal recognition particle receptor protein FtsY (=alpha subunit) (TC 3.A.5.1.1) n=1 Tax=uncultured Sulfurovum sp. TaxID=269237 RepID=A0A6S6TKH4_9BACT|nr:MAG: Signal recognition particle receptor protein FtsY (=alpha subunit) (TC 3.A.5.1.1) [uncultured Sulfurovum sp.]
MLNKDQYNQEEYNDYYRQETEGAELSAGSKEKEGGLMSKLIVLLIILALAIAGYFGYKAMNDSSTSNDIDTSLQVSAESSLPQSVQEEVLIEEPNDAQNDTLVSEEETKISETKATETEKIETPSETSQAEEKIAKVVEVQEAQEASTPSQEATNVKRSLTSEVAKVVGTQGEKMSPEEIAVVVAAVMQQMNQQKGSTTATEATAVKKDVDLMNELSSSEVDSVSTDLVKELEGANVSENTQVNNDNKQMDVYNKVNVQNSAGADTLSQLSDEINAVIDEGVGGDKASNYTKALKNEVSVRKNEMRIIVVGKGDTLGKIAKRAYGNVMEYKKIYRANPELTRPDRIYVGQKLRIPN